MSATTTVEDVVRHALAEGSDTAILEVFDVEVRAGLVRVLLDREGGVDLEALSAANRVVSAALDSRDPIPGRYTLEVSSPGIERPLRTPEHFARHVGSLVSVKTRAGVPGERRIQGELVAVDCSGITISGGTAGDRRLSYDDIDKARTVFDWGGGPGRPAHAPKPHPKNRSLAT